MPRIYKCRKCGQQHGPPTGKQCTNDRDLGTDNPVQDLLPVLMEIESKMGSMEENMANRMGSMEERMVNMEGMDRAESEQGEQEQDSEESDDGETVDDEEGATGGADITPKTLRKDIRAMRKAARRLAKFQDSDSEDEDETVLHTTKRKGKKTGSVLKAADEVKRQIDWPHMYVQRATAGKRESVDYKELRLEEFVFGFVEMLKAQRCKWDKDVMLDMLGMMMQDSMDFAWENARSFYEIVGLDEEKGVRKWTDKEEIRDTRMIHSRTNMNDKTKETPVVKKNSGGRATFAPVKCCALYQRRAC